MLGVHIGIWLLVLSFGAAAGCASAYGFHLHLLKRRRTAAARQPENVSESKEDLVMLAQEQSLLKDAAEQANVAKSQFLANMSHELRTPLNAIIGYSEIILEDIGVAPPEDVSTDAKRIIGAAKHLLAIINDILDVSKIDAGRMALEAAAFDPSALLQETIETLRPAAAERNNTLTLELDAALGEGVSDPFKIKQCLLNLLSNAVKFTRDGRVTLRARREDGPDGAWFVFEVADSGVGMSREQMDALFQPFVQADASVTRKFGGTGLGLAISRRYARLLGGDICVASEVGVGSTFTMRLPVNLVDTDDSLMDAETEAAPDDRPLVVLIEDNRDARDIVKRTLEPLGFAVWCTGGAEQGLQKLQDCNPSLILLDLNLPGKSGWAVLDELQVFSFGEGAPIIILSSESERATTLRRGAVEHLVKPFDRDALVSAALRFTLRQPSPPAGGETAACERPQMQASFTSPASAAALCG